MTDWVLCHSRESGNPAQIIVRSIYESSFKRPYIRDYHPLDFYE